MTSRKHYRKESRYVSMVTAHVSSVQGVLDNMRYDRCVPLTEDDSRKLMRMHNGTADPIDHLVRFMRFAATDAPVTERRWASFGATVLDERDPGAAPLSDEEALTLLSALKACPR